MPIIVHDGGLTFSGKFDFEAFLWLEHPSLDAAEIEAGLALRGDGGQPGPGGAPDAALVWMRRVEPTGGDLAATLSSLADRLASASGFLERVVAEGGRCGCRVVCKVDFNAQPVLDAALLGRLGALGIGLTVLALDVETPATAEGMRRFLAIMNDPPWKRPPVSRPVEEPDPGADDPP